MYEEHVTSAGTERKHFIPTPQGVAAIETDGIVTKTEYLLRDHLNSVDVITNASGQITQKLSFDAFGARRGSNWNGTPSGSYNNQRGYTGHEMLDDFGLIHMNGRVYDPMLGRFIQSEGSDTIDSN